MMFEVTRSSATAEKSLDSIG